jgi:hypothetical protein
MRAFAIVLALGGLIAPASAMADISVTTNTSAVVHDGLCSLNEAVVAADAPSTPSADCPGAVAAGVTTIRLHSDTYTVAAMTIKSGANIAIAGASAADPALSTLTGPGVRPFTVNAGATLALTDFSVTDSGQLPARFATPGATGADGATQAPGGMGGDGSPGVAASGGGALLNNGTTTTTDVVFDTDDAPYGQWGGTGGTGGTGGRTTTDPTAPQGGTGGHGGVGGAGGDGGAIYNSATLVVTGSVFSNDRAGMGGVGGQGGRGGRGGQPGEGTTSLEGTGGSGGFGGVNGRPGNGGAIYNAGTATISSTTFTSDGTEGSAPGDGGVGGAAGPPPDSLELNPVPPGTYNGGGTGGPGGSPGIAGAPGGAGGAIYNTGTLTLIDSTIEYCFAGTGVTGADGGNGGDGGRGRSTAGHVGGPGGPGASGSNGQAGGAGGGIYSSGTLTVTSSTIAGSGAGDGTSGGDGGDGGSGGYAESQSGTGGAGRSAGPGGPGGGIDVQGGSVTLTNVTLSGDSAGDGGPGGSGGWSASPSDVIVGTPGAGGAGGNGANGGVGGALYIALGASDPAVRLSNVTVASNTAGSTWGGGPGGRGTPTGANGTSGTAATAGGGIWSTANKVVLAATLVASNMPTNCSPVQDGGNNLSFGDTTCPGINADPFLGPLQDDGGPTPTRAPGRTGAAIDKIATSACPAVDQRGVARPQGAACDIGAFELGPAPVCHAATAGTAYETAIAVPLSCTEPTGAKVTLGLSLSAPAHGTLGAIDQAAQTVSYTPAAGFVGKDLFRYNGVAGDGTAAFVAVQVTVASPAPPTLTGVPASPSNDPAPLVTGTARSGGTVSLYATTDCSGSPLVTGPAAAFAAPGLATPVAHDATTTLHAKLTDADGPTSDCSSTSVTYTHDGTPPDTLLDGTPAASSEATQPGFAFHASESLDTLQCSIDQGTPSFGACSTSGSDQPPAPLAPGSYTFRVRVIDPAGNADATPATFAFEVRSPPTLTTPPSGMPTPLPSPPAPKVAPSKHLLLPALTSCTSRRRVVIHLKALKSKPTTVVVKVGTKTVATVRGKRIATTISLKTLPKGSFTVTINAVGPHGFRYHETRRYRTCTAPKR